jgi:hypothetical protein
MPKSLNPQEDYNYKFKYPSFKLWLFGGQWATKNGCCVAPPLWKRCFIRIYWPSKMYYINKFKKKDNNYEEKNA